MLIKKPVTKEQRLKWMADQANPRRKVTAGSWLADMAALGKAVVLCQGCAHKWKPSNYGYEYKKLSPIYPTVSGICDGCKNHVMGFLFMPKEK